ncbi:hypothetical protein BAMA_15440 [Bacillus manliponensis]|uniref:Uncharacterized protein n=1 Tax=Bacillus manliponensis TaxID=574376 RepID=A0A073K502_9BACI|nr:hypothetical protein [Bacillus manliponensis]KEK17348.1 hypothetical protein BAMA_15440 [Bacillus manliponensis]
MAYKVLNDFIEKEHDNKFYRKGETYPKEGFKMVAKRVSFLQSIHPEYNVAFLEKSENVTKAAPKEKKTQGSKAEKDGES